MTIEAWLVDYLTSDATVRGIVGTRIFEEIVPNDQIYPAITYTIIGGDKEAMSMLNPNGQITNRMQVSVWATTGVARRTLADAVSLRMDGYRGNWKGKEIQGVFPEGEINAFEPAATNETQRLYGKHLDFEITHVVNVQQFAQE